ncbi:hypothetical protein ACFC5Z_24780 [Streptomyces sp. NPDC056004]|uniref:hypothetical protein n=1 Tax=Streptomyces sp. NPDC056004 TaxID=3345677 RepID=UPI0035DEA29F
MSVTYSYCPDCNPRVDDDVLPGVVQALLVAGRPGLDDAALPADIHRAVLHHPLKLPGRLAPPHAGLP